MNRSIKRSILNLLSATLVTAALPAFADDGRLAQIKAQGELRVCIWPGYFAISYLNPRTGALEGIDIDMAHAFAERLGVKLRFVESAFSKLKQNMQNNACDISMHGVGIREDRKAFVDFSAPYLSSGIYAVGVKSNQHIQKWDDIDRPGNVVVVQKGTYMEPVIRKRLQYADLSVVDSFKAREQEVQSGRADVFMTDYPYGKRMTSLTQWAVLFAPAEPLAPTGYAYAVPKNEPDWLAEVNAFLSTVKANGQLAQSAERHGLSEIVLTK